MRRHIVGATRALLREIKPSKLTLLEIARSAGVDSALLRYYFRDRALLYTEVAREIADDLRARLSALPVKQSVAERLSDQLQTWLSVFAENPHFHELVVEEVFYGEHERAQPLLEKFVRRAYPEIEALVAEGIRRKELRRVEPRFVYVAMIALSEFYATAGPLVDTLFGRRGARRSQLDAYGRFAAELILCGLRMHRGRRH